MKRIVVIFSAIILSLQLEAQIEHIKIHENWKFSCNDSSIYRNANVPGSVFTDLMYHNIISDPFLKDNEKHCQWVAQQTWTYSVSFDIEPEMLKNFEFAEICFEGIDTYADIYLNKVKILSCNNAFRPWKKEIKSLLKPEKNHLKLVFPPIEDFLKSEAKKLSYTLPEGLRVFARKPQFHFGWDWAPKILDISIYKPVYIKFWNGFLFDKIVIHSSNFKNENGLIQSSILTNIASKSKMDFKILFSNSSIVFPENSHDMFKFLFYKHNLIKFCLAIIKFIIML